MGFPFNAGSAAGDAVSPGCGVEAADSAATGVVAVAVGPSVAVGGDCRLAVVKLRLQSATISSPRIVPKVSTFWKGGGGGFGGCCGGGESVLVCCDGGRVEAGKNKTVFEYR